MHKTFSFLKKGQGKLASDYHGETKFTKERKQKIITRWTFTPLKF